MNSATVSSMSAAYKVCELCTKASEGQAFMDSEVLRHEYFMDGKPCRWAAYSL